MTDKKLIDDVERAYWQRNPGKKKLPQKPPKWCVCPSREQERIDSRFTTKDGVEFTFPYCGRCGRNIAGALQLAVPQAHAGGTP